MSWPLKIVQAVGAWLYDLTFWSDSTKNYGAKLSGLQEGLNGGLHIQTTKTGSPFSSTWGVKIYDNWLQAVRLRAEKYYHWSKTTEWFRANYTAPSTPFTVENGSLGVVVGSVGVVDFDAGYNRLAVTVGDVADAAGAADIFKMSVPEDAEINFSAWVNAGVDDGSGHLTLANGYRPTCMIKNVGGTVSVINKQMNPVGIEVPATVLDIIVDPGVGVEGIIMQFTNNIGTGLAMQVTSHVEMTMQTIV